MTKCRKGKGLVAVGFKIQRWHLVGVIPKARVFTSGRRISYLTGLERQPNGTTTSCCIAESGAIPVESNSSESRLRLL